MPKVIAVINQKGGVGKTTTVVNLAAGLSLLSKKILIIDLDPQGNATSGLGINKESLDLTTYDLLIGREKINNIIKQIKIADNKKIYICPATAELAGADIELHDDENRENILKNNIDFEEIKDFDFVIIDCPPSLSLLSINALSASNAILVPIQCEFYAMEGLVQLNKTIGLVKERINENLDIEGFVLTMFDSRNNICKTVVNEVKKFFGDQVMKTIIPKNVKLAESPSFGKCIFNYDKFCLGSKSYMELSKELIVNNGGTYIEKSLGKGLDSLIRSNDSPNSSNVNKKSELFITDLLPNSDQPRKKFDEESLRDLSESIKVHGLLQPITVKNNDDGKFTIIAGERRWRASQIAGIKKVPVNIINIGDKNLFELALVENVQREDLNPVEAAMAIKDLIEKYNFSNEQLIKVTGKKRASISNTLRILELPKKVLNWIIEGKVSRGHAVALLALDNESEIIKFAEQIITKNLSVRDIEKISRVRKIEKNLNISDNRNIYLDNLKKEMETQTGLTIKVKGSTNKGKVEIRYDSLEELNNLIKFFKKMPNFKIDLNIMPIDSVLDPQGEAIENSLKNMSSISATDFKVGKKITFKIKAANKKNALKLWFNYVKNFW